MQTPRTRRLTRFLGCAALALCLAIPAGATPRQVTTNPDWNRAPSWSPTGDEIALASDRAGGQMLDIWVADASGIPLRRLTSFSPERSVSSPAWSADGAFVALYWGSDGGADRREIWLVDAAGGVPVQLTANAAGVLDWQPSWAPDGSLLVFESNRAGNFNLWVMEPARGAAPALLEAGTGHDRFPAWSPDGEWIAFASDRRG